VNRTSNGGLCIDFIHVLIPGREIKIVSLLDYTSRRRLTCPPGPELLAKLNSTRDFGILSVLNCSTHLRASAQSAGPWRTAMLGGIGRD
jgi:hypothetical protein